MEVSMDLGNYQCRSWQTFAQQVINYASNGYYYHNFYFLKEKRQNSLPGIDLKMVTQFRTNMTKDQRYYWKKKGYANYAYLRLGLMIAVLKTEGKGALADNEDDSDIKKRTKYKDFRQEPIVFHPKDGTLSLKIGFYDGQFSLYLTDASYEMIRRKCVDLLTNKRNVPAMLYTFKALNNIPAYSGVFKQKRRLMHFLLKLAKKHHIALAAARFDMGVKLQRRKVYI
jgi:hypothetical protein